MVCLKDKTILIIQLPLPKWGINGRRVRKDQGRCQNWYKYIGEIFLYLWRKHIAHNIVKKIVS